MVFHTTCWPDIPWHNAPNDLLALHTLTLCSARPAGLTRLNTMFHWTYIPWHGVQQNMLDLHTITRCSTGPVDLTCLGTHLLIWCTFSTFILLNAYVIQMLLILLFFKMVTGVHVFLQSSTLRCFDSVILFASSVHIFCVMLARICSFCCICYVNSMEAIGVTVLTCSSCGSNLQIRGSILNMMSFCCRSRMLMHLDDRFASGLSNFLKLKRNVRMVKQWWEALWPLV